MSRILIILLLSSLADAFIPDLLIANTSGVYLQNMTTMSSKTVVLFSHGATYVDFNGPNEIYAILNNTKPESYRIVRVSSIKNMTSEDQCNENNLQPWCYNDPDCVGFCQTSYFKHNSQVFEKDLTDCKYQSNLAVDWVNNNLYWSCEVLYDVSRPRQFTINRATTAGKSITLLKKLGKDHKIWDMKIDPHHRKVFWVQFDVSGKKVNVISSDLDVSTDDEIFSFYTNSTKQEARILLDIHSQKIYLIRGKSSEHMLSHRMDYDGRNVELVNSTLIKEPFNTEEVIRSKLYHPLLQSSNINCVDYGCLHGCQFFMWKGVECLNKTAGTSQPEPRTTEGASKTILTVNTNESSTDDIISDVTSGSYISTSVTNKASYSKSDNRRTNDTAAEASTDKEQRSGHLTMLFFVATVIWVAVFVVGFVIKKKVSQGIYRPASPDNSQISS